MFTTKVLRSLRFSARAFSTTEDKVMIKMVHVNGQQSWDIEAKVGQNLMAVGVDHKVPYEVACGGNAECCTCHVYIPERL